MPLGEPTRTRARALLSLLFCISLGGACFQNLDPNASRGPAPAATASGDQNLTSWQICQAPSCDSPSGDVPVLLDTPVIYLPDGGTTSNACDAVVAQSMTIRQTYCAGCHEAPASQAGLGFILDDNRLVAALSQTAASPDGRPQRLVIPGDPYGSRLYQRVALALSGAAAGMPPTAKPGYPAIPRPSASDVSALYAWIVACVPGADGAWHDAGSE